MSQRSIVESRPSQTARIVDLLRSRSPHWVGLPEILDMRPRISQFSARVWEARHRWGLPIENKVEIVNGEKHSWFRLVEKPTGRPSATVPVNHVPTPPFPQFGAMAKESYGVD